MVLIEVGVIFVKIPEFILYKSFKNILHNDILFKNILHNIFKKTLYTQYKFMNFYEDNMYIVFSTIKFTRFVYV